MPYTGDGGHVTERIAFEGDEVGDGPGGEGAQVGSAEEVRRDARGRPQGA
nr:hypothetical protein [Streptomyces sp. JV180]